MGGGSPDHLCTGSYKGLYKKINKRIKRATLSMKKKKGSVRKQTKPKQERNT